MNKTKLRKIIKEEMQKYLTEEDTKESCAEKGLHWIDASKKCGSPMKGGWDLYEDKDWMQKAFSKNKGGLHKALGVPEGEDIPVSKMADALRAGGKKEKMARAAVNANPDKYGSIKDVGVEKKK